MTTTNGIQRPSVFAGRQAIFDPKGEVFGYELLYRSSEANQAIFADETTATHALLRTVMLDVGLDGLVGGRPAFINVPKAFLEQDLHHAIPRDRVVLEVRDNDPYGADLHVLMAMARRDGYRFALDGFDGTDGQAELLQLVDYVKVDLTKAPLHESLAFGKLLRDRGSTVIAQKVETLEQRDACIDLFNYMQGYFFQRPVVVQTTELATGRLATLQLLAEYSRPDATLEDFEAVINRDPNLTYRVLQLANSGYAGLPRRVDSLREALVFLGIRNVKNLALMASLNRVEDKPAELIASALVRAKTCEHFAIVAGAKGAAGFTTGLLSLIDVLTGIPLDEAVTELHLTDDVRDAILYRTGPLGPALRTAIACERASIEDLEQSDVEIDVASDAFRAAVRWADSVQQVA